MPDKEPAILTVVVDAAHERWLLAAARLDGAIAPFLRSEDGDLSACREIGFDDQVSFLRHRLCGVLQRGHDRLWPAGRKACQYAVVFAGTLPGTTAEVTRRVAEHFAEWMLSPPVVIYAAGTERAAPELERLAGEVAPEIEPAARTAFAAMTAADPTAWELSTRKGTWQPGAGGGG